MFQCILGYRSTGISSVCRCFVNLSPGTPTDGSLNCSYVSLMVVRGRGYLNDCERGGTLMIVRGGSRKLCVYAVL